MLASPILGGFLLATTFATALTDRVPFVVVSVIVFILCVCVHEFGHAWVAHRLGDPTPDRQGRLTLNPVVHMDALGTLIAPVLGAFSGMPLLAWGKPVQISPHLMTRKLSMVQASALVALAGPAANLFFALALGLVMVVLGRLGWSQDLANQQSVLATMLLANISLMVFNLLPIHPLDGGKILAALLPKSWAHFDDQLRQVGPYVLIGLMLLGRNIYAPLLFHAQEVALAVVALCAGYAGS